MVRKSKSISAIIIYPNPASGKTNISIFAEKDELVTVNIRDYTGKLVYSQKAQISKGKNIIPITNLNVYSDGVYHVQLLFDDKMYTIKLIIKN